MIKKIFWIGVIAIVYVFMVSEGYDEAILAKVKPTYIKCHKELKKTDFKSKIDYLMSKMKN